MRHPVGIFRLRGFLSDRRGNVAIIFAVALPALAMFTAAGVELAFLVADRNKMQAVADAAALAGARELTLAMQEGAVSRAQLMAQTALEDVSRRSTVTVNAEIIGDGGELKVTVNSHRGSFFGDLLPPGGFKIRAEAVAERMGRMPLCVLNVDEMGGKDLKLNDTAKLTAGECMVHSNSGIDVSNSGWLLASAVQSIGEARGRITPGAQVGGEPITDPFSGLAFDPPLGGTCLAVTDILTNLGLSVVAGVHCGNIVVGKNQTLNLAPGEHYFKNGDLKLQENAKVVGRNVVLIFDGSGSLILKDNAQVDLEGRQTGKYAGFVIASTRNNTQTFEISTDSARKLLGTIYIPSAQLLISGAGTKVADQSPWTVIVAKSIEMVGSPDLVINAKYASSSVPVPTGVGPTRANARLAR